MATALDIINLALKGIGVLGVGQSALAEDINDAFANLNGMIAQWRIAKLEIYREITTSLVSTGAQSYTVGSGGDFNISIRPNQIKSAFVRQNNVDFPLREIHAREDYNKIRLKNLGTFPTNFFYDPAYPLANLYFWPIPQASIYSLFISTLDSLQKFINLNDVITLPEEYYLALWTNLALILAPLYGQSVSPDLRALARASLGKIKTNNTQIATLEMPRSLRRNNAYYIISDDVGN